MSEPQFTLDDLTRHNPLKMMNVAKRYNDSMIETINTGRAKGVGAEAMVLTIFAGIKEQQQPDLVAAMLTAALLRLAAIDPGMVAPPS